MLDWLKNWLNRRLKEPFTVAHDLGPFWNPINTREELDHVKGLWRARILCRLWVWKHSYGQARIIEGWKYWPEEKKEEKNANS